MISIQKELLLNGFENTIGNTGFSPDTAINAFVRPKASHIKDKGGSSSGFNSQPHNTGNITSAMNNVNTRSLRNFYCGESPFSHIKNLSKH